MRRILLATLILGGTAFLPQAANAFDCTNRFEAAKAAIDKVAADMKAVSGKVSKSDMALVHALLDDAKSMLSGARHNHEKPQGLYDHARAIAKAETARGHAEAAGMMLSALK